MPCCFMGNADYNIFMSKYDMKISLQSIFSQVIINEDSDGRSLDFGDKGWGVTVCSLVTILFSRLQRNIHL